MINTQGRIFNFGVLKIPSELSDRHLRREREKWNLNKIKTRREARVTNYTSKSEAYT